MSSTYKTTNMNLSKWIESDIPEMADFNNDNEILDHAISNHNSDLLIHITNEDRIRWNNGYAFKAYSGNGNTTQSINLNFGFQPSFCLVFAIGNPPGIVDIQNTTHYNYFGIATTSGSTSGLELDGGVLTVTSSSVMIARYEMRSYNEIGKSYLVIGFR